MALRNENKIQLKFPTLRCSRNYFVLFLCTIIDCLVLTFDPTAPTAPPRLFRGHATSSVSLELSWLPPPPNVTNGLVRQYHVQLIGLDITDLQTYIVSETSVGISGLHAYNRYECSVVAMTVAVGPSSAPIIVTTFQDGQSQILKAGL